MKKSDNLLYLDSAIFITYLKEEKEDIGYFNGVVDIFENPEIRGRIITSRVTLEEVQPREEYVLDYGEMHKFIKERGVFVDGLIERLADKFQRGVYFAKKLKYMDAIHVASAIANKCECLYSKDSDMLKLVDKNKGSILKIPDVGEIKIIKPDFQKLI